MEVLSTRELADAVGVSESSIKRWVDEGVIRASRTAGGHRRIPVAEAIRFVRETRATVVRPELLGLADAAVSAADARSQGADDAERLHDDLVRGAAAHARGLLLNLYLSGQSVAAIVDGPVRSALERIGALWRHGPEGIFCEHRATDVCFQAVQQLRLLLPVAPGAPVALGGATEGDPYLLPSLAASTVLAGEGFDAVNLGPDTPFEAFERAVARLAPRLVWISVSAAAQPEATGGGITRLAKQLAKGGAQVVVGGRAVPGLRLPVLPNLQIGSSLGELAAFARGFALSSSGRGLC